MPAGLPVLASRPRASGLRNLGGICLHAYWYPFGNSPEKQKARGIVAPIRLSSRASLFARVGFKSYFQQ
jgi:hypothetical protein